MGSVNHPDALPEEQVALNEATARDINAAIEAGRLADDGTSAFVCECGQLGCNATIDLTAAEYEEVRTDARRFAVARGHVTRVDEVIRDAGRYTIVAKHGRPGEIADRTDPRAEEEASRP
jgi:hypothetical protein